MLELAVVLVVVLHFGVTLVPPLGAFAVARWPRLLWLHVPILAWAFSIPFAQWPCPLTDLEKQLRAQAGMAVYSGHFVENYFWRPLGTHGESLFNWGNTLCIVAGYSLLLRKRAGSSGARAA